MSTQQLNVEMEKAIRWLVKYAPVSDENSRKPMIPHDVRVGVYLYENDYPRDIVLAGILHDMFEFTDVSPEEIKREFGENVVRLILANSKDKTITDKQDRTNELIKRCVANGQDALIIKAADVIDSFKYYIAVKNVHELEYCKRNADAILKFKPDNFKDPIFAEFNSLSL